MERQVENKSILIVKGIMILMIALIVLYDFNKNQMIFITSDELGYWGAAAYFAKLDWSDMTSMWPYYAYGYGLLLAPLFYMTKNALVAYQAAILLNALLMCGTFLLLDRIASKLLTQWNRWLILIAAFSATLYSSAVFFSHMTMVEPLLVFGFCVLIEILLKILETPRNWHFIVSGFLLSYLYMVHLRMVVIIIAFGITLLLLLMTRKVKVIHVCFFCASVAIGLGVSEVVRGQITQALYTNKDLAGGNSYAAQTEKVAAVFTMDGVKRLLLSIVGKIYYLGTSTFLLFYWGIWFLIKRLKEYLIIIKEKKEQMLEATYVFLLLSFLGVLAISAITMMNFGRIDILMYGRYIEFLLGPVLICGIHELYGNKYRWGIAMVLTVLQLCLTGMSYGILSTIDSDELVFPSIIGVYGMAKIDDVFEKDFFSFLTVIKSLFISYALCLGIHSGRRKRYLAGSLLGLTFVWSVVGTTPLTEAKDTSYQKVSLEIANEILKSDQEGDIYYVSNQKDVNTGYDYTYIAYLQFLLPDRKITCLDYTELNENEKPPFIITMANSSDIRVLLEEYDMVYCNKLGLFTKKQ